MMLTRSVRALAAVVVIAGVAVLPAAPAMAALEPAGHPLGSFAGDGAVQTNFATVDTFAEARGVAIQRVGARAGQIVLAGGYQDGFDFHIALLRLNADGTQDMGFGSGGEVKTVIGSNDFVNDVVVQPDDKIVLAGFSDSDFMVVRYLPDGAIDTTFGGGDGIVVTGVVTGQFDRGQAVTLQSDGKILVAGYSEVTSGSTERDMTLMRLNANGSLDTTFSGDGFATFSATTQAEMLRDVFVQPDGKILAVGQTRTGTGTCNTVSFPHFDSVVLRFNANGTPDTTFGANGAAINNLATVGNCPDDGFRSVTIQSDGKIVAAGYANTTTDASTNAKNNISVARFLTNGTLDNTFDGDGRLWTNIASTSGFLSDVADDVVVLADGRILVGASSDGGGPGPVPGTFITENNFAALRYTSTGALDSTFSGDGIGIYDFSENDTFDAMTVDASGRPVLVGYSYVAGQFVDPLVAAARVDTNGVLDATFNSAGNPPGTFFKQLQGGSVDLGAAVVRQATGANAGKLVVVGSTDVGSQTDVGLVRYTTAGAPDTTFSGDGKATGDDAGRNDAPSAATVQSDDKIVVVGTSFGTSGAPRATILRFNADSGLDTSFDGDGVASLTVGTNANQWDAVTIASDGDIYVGGTVSDSSADWDLFVARYNANGTPDNALNGNGRVRLSLGGNVDRVHAIALQSDGKIVVAGSTFINSSAQHFAVVRFNANGTTDASFGGGDGIVITPIGGGAFPRNEITGVAILPDGRIVVGGNGNDGGGSTNNVIRLARYLPNGNLDTTFGTAGIVTTNLAGDRFDRAEGIALQHDEKIVVFGHSQQLFVTRDDFVIARYNWDDGSLDTTYGDTNSGATVLTASLGTDQAAGGVLFPDGSAAIGGTVGSSDLGAARFAGDPAPITPGAPDLVAASDSGQSSTDNITNDNTPTFVNTAPTGCNVGETTLLRFDASLTSPLSRQLCRTGAWTVTAATPLADGPRVVRAFSRNGAGDSADTTSLTITVDTVANPPVITSPSAGQTITIPPSPNVSGTVDETIPGAVVEVREGATLLCTATANAAGNWSCPTDLRPGSHTITARQTDVAGNISADSTAVTFTLKALTTTTLTTSVSPSRFGQAVTFTATVEAIPASLGPPDGNVVFSIPGRTDATVPLASGVATLTIPFGGSVPLPVGLHDVNAAYGGSVGYFASDDDLVPPQEVIKADTTLTWTSTVSPSVTGQPVTFTATVAVVAPGAGVPSGVVDVVIDGGTPVEVPVVNGVATMSNIVLPVGTHTLSGSYRGDSSFNPSAADVTHVVERGATSVAVASSANPSQLGQAVTLTATVTAVAPALGTPGGTVDFVIDGGPPVSVVISGGIATLPATSALLAGNHTVSASYGGSGDFLPSAGALAGGQTVNQGATATTVTATPSPSSFGQVVTFTATVTPLAPATTPVSGAVTFDIGGTVTAVTLTNGQAVVTSATIPVGTHAVTATYSGDANYTGSTGTVAGGHTVAPTPTTTTFTASPNPSVFGEPVTLTATVSAAFGTPDGTVDFTLPSGVETVALVGGTATLVVDAAGIGPLPTGSHALQASYSGSASYLPSTAGLAAPQAVNQASTTLTWTATPTPSILGEAVTFAATVTANPPGSGTPTGVVAVTVDGAPAIDIPLDGSGTASLTTDQLGVGDHTVVGTYSGDTNFAASSDTVLHAVQRAPSTVVVNTSQSPSQPGESVTFTAAVTPGGPGVPTGSVDFVVDGGTPLSVAVDAAGVASLTLSTLSVGQHTITVAYSGDSQFAPSTSSVDQTVVQGATATTLTAGPASPTQFGEPVTFTITVTPLAPALTAPTGSVTIDIGGNATTLTLDGNQQAQLTATDLPVGSYTVSASYAGDANYTASVASDLAHVVESAITQVQVQSSANPSVFGQPVTFTATVSAPASNIVPDGTVTFAIGGDSVVASLTGGVATVTTAELGVGAHSVSASYSGTGSFAAGSGNLASSQTVTAAATQLTLASAPEPVVSGQPLTISATVTPVAPGAGTPTGSVSVSVDGGAATTVALSGGTAELPPVTLLAGTHTIAVSYAGDGRFTASAATFTRTVQTGGATVNVTASPNNPSFGEPITLTAVVTANAPATGDPKGTVEFIIDGGPPIEAQLQSPASITIPALGAGNHSVVVNYLGSGQFAPASGVLAGGLTVGTGAASLTVASSPNPAVAGQPVTVTATVSPTAGVTPTGTVQVVIDGGAPITLTLVNGTATLVTQTLSVGSHTVVATYSGDANYAGTTASLSGGQTIVAAAGTPSGGGGRLPSTGGQPFRGVEAALALVAVGVTCLGVRRASVIATAPSRRRR